MNSRFTIRTVANLTVPTTVPPEGTCRYGICLPFQVSPDTAGLFCGVRGSRGYDFEVGTDVILFKGLSRISAERAIAISRKHEAVNPNSSPPGQPALMVKYPVRGGFVPLGARLEDGSPHPHAGTGFGVSMSVSWTADQRKEYPMAEKHHHVEVYQLAYDGVDFRVSRTDEVPPEEMLEGAHLLNPGVCTAIPDGEDLLLPMGEAVVADAQREGIVRWRRGREGWRPVGFVAVVETPRDERAYEGEVWRGADAGLEPEPSLVRDRDGSLLFCARGDGEPFYNDVRLWRSRDGGQSWTQVVYTRGGVASAPITINVSRDATPYIGANLYDVLEEPRVEGFAYPRDAQQRPRIGGWLRHKLALWPLDSEREELEAPFQALDCKAEYGPAPSKVAWIVDHPVSYTVRLGDGGWHNLLCTRICDMGEVWSGSGPTERSGTHIQEVASTGESRPTWLFQS